MINWMDAALVETMVQGVAIGLILVGLAIHAGLITKAYQRAIPRPVRVRTRR